MHLTLMSYNEITRYGFPKYSELSNHQQLQIKSYLFLNKMKKGRHSIASKNLEKRKFNISLRCLNHFAKCVFQCLVREFERKSMKFKNLTHITYICCL